MKSIIIISLLVCALLSFSTSTINAQKSTIHIELKNNNNNRNKIIIDVQNTLVDTIAVQMKDSSSSHEWIAMQQRGDDDGEVTSFWSITSDNEFVFPLSLKLTSEENQNIILENIIDNELGDDSHKVIDTGVQYSTPDSSLAPRRRRSSPVDQQPSSVDQSSPVDQPSVDADQSSNAPRRKRPTTAPTARPTRRPTTAVPSLTTRAPPTSTQTPTARPTTTTTTPTNAPTQPSPGGIIGGGGSSNGMKLLVPLYTYPGASWTAVAAGAAAVKTVAIINPNSGPGNGPDAAYNTYMNTLNKAGVEMIGYVHTSYGTRSINDVKADIDKYASEFPLVVGIFIDEAAATSTQVAYYTQVHNYIMSMPGYKYNVLNPGAVPVQAYMSISTQIVSFENTASQFASSANPVYANSSNKDHFAVITYAAPSTTQMQAAITTAKNKGYYGWVYVTDGSGASTYNTLASYYQQQTQYIAAANSN